MGSSFKLRKWFNRRILHRFFLNTLILVLLPFVLLTILDRNLTATLSNEAINSERRALSLAISRLNEDVEQIQRFALNLGKENNCVRFSYREAPLNSESRFYAFKVMQSMRGYAGEYGLLYNTCVFFPRSERIISGSGMYNPYEYYELFVNDPQMDQASWKSKWFSESNDMVFTIITSSVGGGYARNQLHLLNSVTFNDSDECACVVDLVLDQNWVITKLSEIRKEGAAYIRNRDGETIIACGDSDRYPIPEQIGYWENSVLDLAIDGESVKVISDLSSATGWQYVLVIPASVLTGGVYWVQRTEIVLRMVSIVTAVLCAMIITAVNYRPIERLTKTALQYSPDPESVPKGMNEIDLIHHNIQNAYIQNQELTRQQDRILEKYNQMLQTESQRRNFLLDSLILRLIRGSVPDWETMESWLATSGIAFPHPFFCVALVHVSNYNSSGSDDIAPDKKASILSMIGMMLHDLCETIGGSYSVSNTPDTIACLINTGGSALEVIAILEKTRDALRDGNGIILSIGTGSLQQSLVDLQLSYQEAQAALEYRFVKGKGLVISYDETRKDDRTPISLSDDFINQIDAALLRNNTEQLEKLLERLRAEYPIEDMSMFKAQSLYYSVINAMMNTLGQTSIDIRQVFGEDFDPLDAMASCETISEVIEQMEDILRAICSYKADTYSGGSAKIAAEAMRIIRENFYRPEFSQQWVADQLNVSSAYLSRSVKQETGRNMIDIINILRVEKARRYLLETDLSMAEIADKIGFGSTKSLMRIFRQYVGMTPGQLRERDHLENVTSKGEENG